MQDLNRLNFDPKKKAVNDANLLDLLKKQADDNVNDPDSGHGTDPGGPSPSQSVEQKRASLSKTVVRLQQQQHPQKYLVSDSSSCGGYESGSAESEKDIVVLAAEHIQTLDIMGNKEASATAEQQEVKKPKKKSFWQKLLRSSSANNS